MLINCLKKVVRLLLAVVVSVPLSCASPSVDRGGNRELDAAIALYIDGQYESAVEKLVELTKRLESEGDIQTAYLYLGRSYVSLGDYARAADAFSTGRLLGGGVQFDQHLEAAQQHLRSAPRTIRSQTSVTRAQLTALIDNLFTDALGDLSTPPDDDPIDLQHHWAREYVRRVRAAGIMDSLPDGNFHPDAYVTYPAFYVVFLRLANALSISPGVALGPFSGGFRGALAMKRSASDSNAASMLISGEEATAALQSLLSKASK